MTTHRRSEGIVLTQRYKTAWLLIALIFVTLLAFTTNSSTASKRNTVQVSNQVVKPDKPINCEDFQAYLDHAIIDWRKLEGTYLIAITRLGTGEGDRNLNRTRLEYIEEYLKSHNVQYLLAEAGPVNGLGRFEVFVGGRLVMSIPIKKGATRLCLGGTGG